MEYFACLIAGFIIGAVTIDVKWKSKSERDHGILKSNSVRLKQIINNAELKEAPQVIKFISQHYEVQIGIGPDHTAAVYIDRAALDELANVYI